MTCSFTSRRNRVARTRWRRELLLLNPQRSTSQWWRRRMKQVSTFLSVRVNRANSISIGKRIHLLSIVALHFSFSVHLTNQAHRKDSIFAEQQESKTNDRSIGKYHSESILVANQPVETSNPTRRWTPFANIRDPSMVSIKKSAATDADLPSSNSSISNKPIQTVASFSSLTDAVKNAMKKGSITAGPSPLSRPDKRSSVSSKDLNHLSPQSM